MSDLALRPQDLGIGHLFERVRDAVIVADAHTGRIVLWNSAATAIFGYSVPEVLEMSVEELVPERLRERHRAGLSRYRETGRGDYIDSNQLLELPAMRNTGEEIRIEMSLSPIEPTRDVGDEERRYALAIVRDITARKRTEDALRESEARFHALVQNSLDIVMVTDTQGTIRYISPSIERVLGHRSEEMVGTNTAEYVHPDDLERALGKLAEATSRPGVYPVAVETRVRHKDGSWRHLEGIANNLLEDPAVGGIMFSHRDVTERRQAEEEVRRLNEDLETRVKERTARLEAALAELRASEERYRAVVKQSTDGIYLVEGQSRRILETNPALQKMLGYSAEELQGMELHRIVAHDHQSVEANIERTLREGTRFIRERRYRRKDGTEVDVEVAASAISYGGMRVICAAIRDITQRKRAEEAMRAAREAERRRIARDLHDDVLQDLSYTTAAMGMIMLDAEGTDLGDELQKAIDAVRRAAQGLRAAVNDLRLGEERNRPFAESVQILVERSRTRAQGYEIRLEVEEGFPLTPLGDDGVEMLRIIHEALTNARRHSGAASVLVSLRREGAYLVTEISDDGRGFELETASGVGLSSMRERAAALGGHLEIESGAGRGASVRLRVPAPQKG